MRFIFIFTNWVLRKDIKQAKNGEWGGNQRFQDISIAQVEGFYD